MAAFDRVMSGIPQMDERYDNIRLGDNVVWRVDSLEDFKLFAKPYVEQAIKDKRILSMSGSHRTSLCSNHRKVSRLLTSNCRTGSRHLPLLFTR